MTCVLSGIMKIPPALHKVIRFLFGQKSLTAKPDIPLPANFLFSFHPPKIIVEWSSIWKKNDNNLHDDKINVIHVVSKKKSNVVASGFVFNFFFVLQFYEHLCSVLFCMSFILRDCKICCWCAGTMRQSLFPFLFAVLKNKWAHEPALSSLPENPNGDLFVFMCAFVYACMSIWSGAIFRSASICIVRLQLSPDAVNKQPAHPKIINRR